MPIGIEYQFFPSPDLPFPNCFSSLCLWDGFDPLFGTVRPDLASFGEILPLWQNFKSLWLIFEG